MGTGEFPAPATISIPMRYAVLLRDLRLSVPVFDDNFNPDEFASIFGALKGLQVRMVKFEHNLDKIELGMNKLEHRIDTMEHRMEQLQKELDPDSPHKSQQQQQQQQHDLSQEQPQHYYVEDCPARSNKNCSQDRGQQLLTLEPHNQTPTPYHHVPSIHGNFNPILK